MSKYYYVLNLQGDVVQLVDSENGVVANYTYDAWGKLLSVTDASGNAITNTLHISNVNPIRYRGYFYDTETGLYYCNSRYYDPQMRRFINADGYTSTGQGFGGFNMFAYCQNNPVMYTDSSGEFLQHIVDFIDTCVNTLSNMVNNLVKFIGDRLTHDKTVWPTGKEHRVDDWPVYKNSTDKHYGTDIVEIEGTAVLAVTGGTVETVVMDYPNSYNIYPSNSNGLNTYGNYIDIKVDDNLIYRYAHLQQTDYVTVGESVKSGQQIGCVGNTGNSYKAHLHFEVIEWDVNSPITRRNPQNYLPPLSK